MNAIHTNRPQVAVIERPPNRFYSCFFYIMIYSLSPSQNNLLMQNAFLPSAWNISWLSQQYCIKPITDIAGEKIPRQCREEFEIFVYRSSFLFPSETQTWLIDVTSNQLVMHITSIAWEHLGPNWRGKRIPWYLHVFYWIKWQASFPWWSSVCCRVFY